MHVGEVAPKEIPPVLYPFSPHHNPNVSYAFHAGYIGHIIEDCYVFKIKVQNLIDHNIVFHQREDGREGESFVESW